MPDPLFNLPAYELCKLNHMEGFLLGNHARLFIVADVPFSTEFVEMANRAFVQLQSKR